MKPKDFENLEDEFELAKIDSSGGEIISTDIQESTKNLDLDKDYKEVRDNLKDIVKKGTEAIDGISLVASETQHPRAYEVLATLIKSVADVNKDIMSIHKQMKDIKGEKEQPKVTPTVTNNSIHFVGSTKELQDLVKKKLNIIEGEKIDG
jgi:riboflavin synthase alpha subunit